MLGKGCLFANSLFVGLYILTHLLDCFGIAVSLHLSILAMTIFGHNSQPLLCLIAFHLTINRPKLLCALNHRSTCILPTRLAAVWHYLHAYIGPFCLHINRPLIPFHSLCNQIFFVNPSHILSYVSNTEVLNHPSKVRISKQITKPLHYSFSAVPQNQTRKDTVRMLTDKCYTLAVLSGRS